MSVRRWAIILVGLVGLSLVYLTIASHAPWPVYGAAGFVWGAGLVAVAICYVLTSRDEIPRTGLAWGIVLAIIGYLVPIVLNQLLNWEPVHELHKLLAFIGAFIVFIVWITAVKDRTRRRVSAGVSAQD